jgi:D-alanyl-D-alanine dipeptidase
MPEPIIQKNINLLRPNFRNKIEELMNVMEMKGYDPIIFESLRSNSRQNWLYSIGRTYQKNRKPVTWTLQSKHLTGEACDIISKSKGWNNPKFFEALQHEAHLLGLHTIPQEQCHIQE